MNPERYARGSRLVGVPGDVVPIAYIILVDVAVATNAVGGISRLVAVAPLLVVLPGYALLSLLYPGGARRRVDHERRSLGGLGLRSGGLAWRERLLLSFGLSVALLPLFGFVVAAAGTGFSTLAALAVPSVFTVACLLLGTVRRHRLPAGHAYEVPVRSWLAELDAALFDAPDRREAVLNAVLVLVVAGALVGMSAAVVAPPSSEAYTSLSLLTTSPSGDYVESGYPSTVVAGEPQSLVAGVTNHEDERTDYTIVVELHRVSTEGGSTTVLERRSLARQQATVAPGETWYWSHNVSTQMLGDELRLTYMLYRGSPPESASTDSAYRTAYLWIAVTESSPSGG